MSKLVPFLFSSIHVSRGASYRGYRVTQEYRSGSKGAGFYSKCCHWLSVSPWSRHVVKQVLKGACCRGLAGPQGAYASLARMLGIRSVTPVFTVVHFVAYLMFNFKRINNSHSPSVTHFLMWFVWPHFTTLSCQRDFIYKVPCYWASVCSSYEPHVSTPWKWNLYPLDPCRLIWFWAKWK